MPYYKGLLDVISKQEKVLDEAERILSELTGKRGITAMAEIRESADVERALKARSMVLSSITISSSIISKLINELESIPGDVLEHAQNYLNKLWSIIISYTKLFEIDKITITITTPPSITIEMIRKD